MKCDAHQWSAIHFPLARKHSLSSDPITFWLANLCAKWQLCQKWLLMLFDVLTRFDARLLTVTLTIHNALCLHCHCDCVRAQRKLSMEMSSVDNKSTIHTNPPSQASINYTLWLSRAVEPRNGLSLPIRTALQRSIRSTNGLKRTTTVPRHISAQCLLSSARVQLCGQQNLCQIENALK